VEAIQVLAHLQKPTVSRPRPEASGRFDPTSNEPGGEGGNRSARLAAIVGPNALLAMALLLSALLVGLATAALR
jgi:hypothetical protein